MFDGDLVLVVDEPTMMAGVERDVPFVMDVEDKITALSEEFTQTNLLNLTLRNFNSLIGEASNAATTYHNIIAKSPEQQQKYLDYIDTLSVVTGKSIDAVKTGVVFNIPRHIAKYAKPLPYFMKYRSNYYKGLKKFRHSNSNMNLLCYNIERWEKVVMYNKLPKDPKFHKDRNISFVGRGKKFDHSVMVCHDKPYTIEEYGKIEKVFLDFSLNMQELAKEQYRLRNYDKYKDWIEDNFPTMKKDDAQWYTVDWDYYYNSYRLLCKHIVQDPQVLANIVVDLAYRKYKSKNKNFLWVVASEGILKNLVQQPVYLPKHDEGEGYINILGKLYKEVLVEDDQ